MEDEIILRTVVRILVPFIFLYGLYVQFHGDFSAGGGFQAGVICAAAFIIYSLVFGLMDVLSVLPIMFVRLLSALGVLLYAGVGIVATAKGGKFLEYSVLSDTPVHGQTLGIMIVELGVGITVFSVMMLVFYTFAERSR